MGIKVRGIMSDLSTPLDYLVVDTRVLFGPKYLNLPGLPPHIPLIALSALFYQLVYSLVAPLLWNLLGAFNPDSKTRKVTRSLWYINIVSIAQSAVNTALAIYLLSHPEFRHGLTAQERILGYHKETARVLAVSMGYFVFHLGSTWVQRGQHGMFMFFHAVCALFAVSLGYVSFERSKQRILSLESDHQLAATSSALHCNIPHLGTP
jgi:hypothetical protein